MGEIVRVRQDARGHQLTGQPLIAAPNGRGYLSLSLCRDARAFNRRVNRVVCEAFHGPAPSKRHHAAHENGDSLDNRASNLSWKLPVENASDKLRHGTARLGDQHWSKSMPERRARGEGHGLAKLNADAVRAIREDTRAQRVVAAEYGVNQRSIWAIKAGKTWGHVA